MGRGGFNRRNRGGGRRREGGRANGSGNSYNSYPEIVKKNEKLQAYYDGLLGLDGEQKEAFWAAFHRELPHSFRFCGSKGHALAVQKLLQTRYIPALAKISHYDGLPVSPPQPVPWYPDNLSWWMTTPKTVIRKFPPFAAFKKFLVSETSVGNISRQEVVSMIPPLLLDVRPGMAVLDLCAAPGSKAAQLLEMIHQGEEARVRKVLRSLQQEGKEGNDNGDGNDDNDDDDPASKLSADPSDDGRATGVLIANDSDYKRSHLLIHQLKRLSSPNIIVTNHDATIYPSLRLPPLPAAADESGKKPSAPAPVRYLKFDRILADVPCSGDGTLRKNVTMWKDWTPASALGLHLVQVRILVRALQMLRPGGRVVYSTCSLNPVENEAVVAAAIHLCGGSSRVDILDSSDKLPQLQRYPGLKKWHIMDKNGRLWHSWAEVQEFAQQKPPSEGEKNGTTEAPTTASSSHGGGGVIPSRVVPSMFPNEASDQLPLERCMRVYPHLQDTGGFFIVALEKKAEFKAKPISSFGTPAASSAAPPAPEADAGADADAIEKTEGVEEEEQPAEAPVEELPKTATAKRPAEDEAASVTKKAKQQEGEDTEMTDVVKKSDEEEKHDAVSASTPVPVPVQAPAPAPAGRLRNSGPYEEPFKYLAPDHPVVQEVQAFYQLSPRFPSDRFMVRNAYGEPAKGIYYTSQLVRDILVCNSSEADSQHARKQNAQPSQQQLRVKFVHGGVRMFVKQEAPSAGVCRWRIQSEGMPLLQGYVGEERVVRLHSKATLRALLVEMFPKFVDGGWKRLGEVGQRLPDIGMGCFVLKVEGGKETEGQEGQEGEKEGEAEGEKEGEDKTENIPLEPMALPLWKSFHSLNLMLPKEDRAAMLLRIFNDTTPLVNNALDKKKKEQEEQAQAASKEEEAPAAADEAAVEPAVQATAAADSVDTEINDYDAEDAPSS